MTSCPRLGCEQSLRPLNGLATSSTSPGLAVPLELQSAKMHKKREERCFWVSWPHHPPRMLYTLVVTAGSDGKGSRNGFIAISQGPNVARKICRGAQGSEQCIDQSRR